MRPNHVPAFNPRDVEIKSTGVNAAAKIAGLTMRSPNAKYSIANAGRELEIADAALIRSTKIKDRAVRPGGRKREARKFGGIIADLAAARTGVSVEHIAPVQFSKAVLARASSRFVATPRSETL